MDNSRRSSMSEFLDMRFEDIVTLRSVYKAWQDFSKGKMHKQDVQFFYANLEDELISILRDLLTDQYIHGPYARFIVHDPKRRIIHKATVRDRVIHRLVYNKLLPIFHSRLLDCSFSCRPSFGQHRSIEAVRRAIRQVTQNGSRECWILKIDVRKFFDSVDHNILFDLLCRSVTDKRLLALLQMIIQSFAVTDRVGLPIGNLTSQLFANVYLHELGRCMKHTQKQRWYFRYADDMLLLSKSGEQLVHQLVQMDGFLQQALKLRLHPKKIFLRKSTWGFDWLGRVMLPGHEVLRPSTRRRMMKKVHTRETLASYNGLLKGAARHELDKKLLQSFAFQLACGI